MLVLTRASSTGSGTVGGWRYERHELSGSIRGLDLGDV